MTPDTFDSVSLDLLPEPLAQSVRMSLESGIAAGAVFEDSGGPDDLFRGAVKRAIRAIESKDRSDLLPRFLSVGPYFGSGQIPPSIAPRYQSDDEVAAAIRFIFSSAINSFQGQLAEMLAVGPVVRLARRLGTASGAGPPARVYAGDTVLAHPLRRRTWAKAADFHLLEGRPEEGAADQVTVRAVVEVKSYAASAESLRPQLERHLARARRGLLIQGHEVRPERVAFGGTTASPSQIVVVPATWELPRAFQCFTEGERTLLDVEPPAPPTADDAVDRIAADRWQVTLRWSQEALADTAYAMTFWYMGELGRILYEEGGVPAEWEGMSPEEAGQNAVKMMLYYAILRARTVREESRAIALYNSYGFGYALGANFVDRKGRREVLFFDDLKEILETGRSRTTPIDANHPAQHCRIRGFEPEGG